MPAALRPAAPSVGASSTAKPANYIENGCPVSIVLARTTFENARSAETLMPQESQYCWHLRRLLRGEWHSGVPDWRCLARPDRLGASGIRRERRAVCRTSAVHPAPADGSDTPSAARHSRSVDRQTRRSWGAKAGPKLQSPQVRPPRPASWVSAGGGTVSPFFGSADSSRLRARERSVGDGRRVRPRRR